MLFARPREQKRHIKLLHIKLFPVAPVTGPPGRVSGQKVYVPWVPRIAHKTLTPGLPVGRPPGHRRGHWPKRFMFMCLFLSWRPSCCQDILEICQDDGKGGLSLRGGAFMTVLAVLAVLVPGEDLALLLLALQNTVPRDDRGGFDGCGGCGGSGRDGYPP